MGSHGPGARGLLDWLFIGASAETGAPAARVALAPRLGAFAISALTSAAAVPCAAAAVLIFNRALKLAVHVLLRAAAPLLRAPVQTE